MTDEQTEEGVDAADEAAEAEETIEVPTRYDVPVTESRGQAVVHPDREAFFTDAEMSWEELEAFMAMEHHYQRFIVQALIGNSSAAGATP